MSKEHDDAMRLANEMAALCRKVADGLPLTPEQLEIADDIAVQLAIGARQMRFDIAEQRGIELPSLMDAAALALAFIQVDYRERMQTANPIPPPPDDIDD